MTNNVSEVDGKLIVKLSGEVDLESCEPVRSCLLESAGQKKDLLVDLSGVTYIDSSGVASLIEALQMTTRNGAAFKLFSVSDPAFRVLQLAKLDQVFAIHPDFDAAIAS